MTIIPMRSIAIHNLGCKVNAYEAESMRRMFEEHGYEIVPFESKADVYVINTCSVTNIADRKSRQMLHRARKMNPGAIVVATGCYARTGKNELDGDREVDIIIEPDQRSETLDIIESRLSEMNKPKTADLSFIQSGTGCAGINESRCRMYLKIQDGCDRFCSYCIIPYARGRSVSRDRQDITDEAERIADSGCREIVITGINISAYGKESGQEASLAELISDINDIKGIERIRLSSVDPGMITGRFLETVSGLSKLCPHFHLSLQSGCNRTLKRMNRHYTVSEYAEKCQMIRSSFVRPSITTDIICGFPGETDEEFEESYEFVKSISFFETHVFPYSKRKGTAAAGMSGQLTGKIKKARVEKMLELNEREHKKHLMKALGSDMNVLFEEERIVSGKRCWYGHTERYEEVITESDEDLRGEIRECRPEHITGEGLVFAGLGF